MSAHGDGERIERLEERFAFLERDLEVMSEVVRELGDRNDRLTRELARLREQLRERAAQEGGEDGGQSGSGVSDDFPTDAAR